ncbi:hypothetical protein BOX15_Mlig024407g2 [Macrostomum lignano]|uniref:Uncharacterized protein n=1 Tax=Macrostomum lignano TaxID=282301 RepID=A0A267G2K7_9PLAT|nr:hypothetical protein BOX15_Mlig024407g2 [Macrostomum lignano]
MPANSGRTVIETKNAPIVKNPLSQAVMTSSPNSRLLFLSGQCGLLPDSGQLAGLDTESQARQALRNVGAVLAAAGVDYNSVLKCTALLADIRDAQSFNSVYAEFFQRPYPARECYQVSNLPAGARVEIIVVAEVATDSSSGSSRPSAKL